MKTVGEYFFGCFSLLLMCTAVAPFIGAVELNASSLGLSTACFVVLCLIAWYDHRKRTP